MSIPSKDMATTPGPTAPAKTPNQHLRRNPPIAGEAEAIQKAQAGDSASFEILYSLHKRRVYSLCLRMLGNVAEAEDLTQEAFLQLYRKIATFRGDSAFSTWLHRLAVNVVLMHLRKKGIAPGFAGGDAGAIAGRWAAEGYRSARPDALRFG